MAPDSAEELWQIVGQFPPSFIESAPVARPAAIDQIGGVIGWIEYRCENVILERDPDGIIRFVMRDIEDEWIKVGQIKDLTPDLLVFKMWHS